MSISEINVKLWSNALRVSSEFVGINAVIPQSIRWRKPRWLPPGKTKLFRVNQRVNVPADESAELRRLFHNYFTSRKSIRQYLMSINAGSQVMPLNGNVEVDDADLDFELCNKINDEWNAQIATMRDARLVKEWESKKVYIATKVEEKYTQDALEKEKASKYIRKIKDAAFITRENIDQAIAEALENVVNYNVAIDKSGKEYHDIIRKLDKNVRQQDTE